MLSSSLPSSSQDLSRRSYFLGLITRVFGGIFFRTDFIASACVILPPVLRCFCFCFRRFRCLGCSPHLSTCFFYISTYGKNNRIRKHVKQYFQKRFIHICTHAASHLPDSRRSPAHTSEHYRISRPGTASPPWNPPIIHRFYPVNTPGTAAGSTTGFLKPPIYRLFRVLPPIRSHQATKKDLTWDGSPP